MAKEPVRVLVIGAAGRIGYALVPMIARGIMFGADQPVILHMLDIPFAAEALNGVKMELIDAAFPLLKGVVATTDAVEGCTSVNVAVMVGCFPRMDIMLNDVSIYKSQVAALDKHAAPNCKVLVVANPVDTNALILKEYAPSISEKNITCLTRLEHNMVLGHLAESLNIPVSDVKNVIIWGNYLSTEYTTLYPDVNHAIIKTSYGENHVRELVKDDDWLNGEFITKVQQAAIIKARGLASAISEASSACDHIRDWVLGTPEGTFVSMGVYSDGSYNVTSGLMYSFPVTCSNGEWTIVKGLSSTSQPYSHYTLARQPRIDGKEFFRQARSRLSDEQFSAFQANIKELNAKKQSLEETMLQKAEEIFGMENNDLYVSLKELLLKQPYR